MSRVRSSCLAAMQSAIVPPTLLVYIYLRFGVLVCLILAGITYVRWQTIAHTYGDLPLELFIAGMTCACIATALFGFLWRLSGLPTGIWIFLADRLSDD